MADSYGTYLVWDKTAALVRAKAAAADIQQSLAANRKPRIALVLGTGWGDTLRFDNPQGKPLKELNGAESLPELQGHDRMVVVGELEGQAVIALRGRVHLNEHPFDPRVPIMVRLQIQMLCELGVKWLILTNAAGSLWKEIPVGSLVIAEGFMSVFAPPMPLFAGEFVSPDSALCSNLRLWTQETHKTDGVGLELHRGVYAMLRGPQFEGACDKNALKALKASVVGMSTYPEACIAAGHQSKAPRILALSFVTNSAFEPHSHETNMARAKEQDAHLGLLLRGIVRRIGRNSDEDD